jgi:hypothetical protein
MQIDIERLKHLLARYGKSLLAFGLVSMTVAMFGVLVIQGWPTIRQFPWQLDPLSLALALLFHATSTVTTFLVWRLMMKQLGSLASLRTDFYVFYISLGARKIPSIIWFAGTRTYLYKQEGADTSVVANALALDFSIALLTGTWTYTLFLPGYRFVWNHQPLSIGILVIAIALTTLLLARPQLFVEITQRIGRRWKRETRIEIPSRQNIALWSLIYLAAWVIGGIGFYFTVRALAPTGGPNWINSVGAATLATLVVLVNSLIPLGIGLKELATGALLASWLPTPVGLAVALVYRLLQTADEILWMSIAYLTRHRGIKSSTDGSQDSPE